ncbi:hypothetical protein PR202_gb03774 [Eleusine coracana subsp. coracana]|uniref:Crossover junction endonuclease MUS81 n=1 Tax=Eleusine coracana subsp. coracana TaxID=191504 RepID=A0AAV5E0B4_ELECO|nr:hypothetical protein PR202_gb03774 [Eleusine coracana subsp. coracana]
MPHRGTSYVNNAMLAMPPRQSNENFLEAYEVVLILDDREKFGFGDGTEYVLDYIVERKNLLDLDDSITDNRYKDQKLRLKRCGLRKVIYLVEGDPKSPHVSEKAKTACFTTEILDGFDILRTSGYAETERQYVYLTSSIIEYCNTNFSNLANTSHDGDTRAQEEMLQKKSKKVNAGASRNIFKLVWAEG